jgi:hypothetical protein
MEPSGLSFFTVKQLVDELMRRKTFLGVVLHSDRDVKGTSWNGEHTFQVHFNANLNAAEAARLLYRVSDYIELNHA